MRAIDVLCALPQVDPSRIGMIGHSLGADTTLWAMPFDQRISAAAISCGGLLSFEQRGELLMGLGFADILKLIAPRAFFESVGYEDFPNICMADLAGAPLEQRMAAKRHTYEEAGAVYAAYNARERLMRYEFDGGHCFPASAREAAYAWLERWLRPAGVGV